MDGETILYLVLVVGGLFVVIAIMVFVMNPPEAWVKKAFMKKSAPPPESKDRPK